MNTTIYTVIYEEGPHPFETRILTPKARKPSEMGFFDDPGEASQETKAHYGQDAEYVSPEAFEQECKRRAEVQQQEELQQAEKEPFELDVKSVVRGTIIGALAGGHMDGPNGASYSKSVLLQIADLLSIEIPAWVKDYKGGMSYREHIGAGVPVYTFEEDDESDVKEPTYDEVAAYEQEYEEKVARDLDAIDRAEEFAEQFEGDEEEDWQAEATSNYYRDLGIRSPRLY